MSRFGNNRGSVSALLILGWLLIWPSATQANMRFYTIVQQICSTYNISVSQDQMQLVELESDSASFHLVRQSRRNNLEQVTAVGYIAAGQAISRTGLDIKTIRITIVIPNADYLRVLTEADVTLVDAMRLGKIKPSEFMSKLDWN